MKHSFAGKSIVALVMALCSVLAAAPVRASDWPMYGHDISDSRYNPNETAISATNAATLQQKWFFHTGPISSTPAVVSGVVIGGSAHTVVYVGSWDHNFYAVDAITGTKLWSITLATLQGDLNNFPGIQSSAAVDNGTVYFGDSCGYLHAYAADGSGASPATMTNRARNCGSTGTERPGFPVDLGAALPDPSDAAHTDIFSSPIPYTPASGQNHGRRLIYVGAASHRDGPCIHGAAFAVDASTGKIVWRFDTVPPTAQGGIGGAVWSSPAIDANSDLVYISTGDCVSNASTGFSESIVALDASCSGTSVDGSCTSLPAILYPPGTARAANNPVWAFQAHPNGEIADFDFGASPNVFTGTVNGNPTNLVGAGSKDGSYYTVKGGRSGGQPVWDSHLVNAQTSATTVTVGNSIGTALGGYEGTTAAALGKIFGTTSTGPEFAPAMDAGSGLLLWDGIDALSSFGAVGVANGLVFAGDNAGFFRIRDANTGLPLFVTDTETVVSGGPAIAAGMVFIGNGLLSSEAGVPENAGLSAFAPMAVALP